MPNGTAAKHRCHCRITQLLLFHHQIKIDIGQQQQQQQQQQRQQQQQPIRSDYLTESEVMIIKSLITYATTCKSSTIQQLSQYPFLENIIGNKQTERFYTVLPLSTKKAEVVRYLEEHCK